MSKRTDLPRIPRDLYETWHPPAVSCISPLLHGIRYIEPCFGSGALVANIKEHEPTARCVLASDIEPLPRVKGVDKEFSVHKRDIFEADGASWLRAADHTHADIFLTNPPWLNDKASNYQLLRIIFLLSYVRPTWLLLNANFAFNKRSSDAMAICTDMYTAGRLKWIRNSQHASTEDSAWFVFDPSKATGSGPTLHPRNH